MSSLNLVHQNLGSYFLSFIVPYLRLGFYLMIKLIESYSSSIKAVENMKTFLYALDLLLRSLRIDYSIICRWWRL